MKAIRRGVVRRGLRTPLAVRGPGRLDDGIGLVEVMVSMLLFAIILVMTVGVLVSGIRVTARNSTIASATHWAAEQMDLAHTTVAGLDAVKACPAWQTFRTAAAPPDRVDGRGIAMHMVLTADAAPADCLTSTTTPVVTYTVKVVEAANPTKVLATSTARLAIGLE